MNTLKRFLNGIEELPAGITWYLTDISEAKEKQFLYTNQSSFTLSQLHAKCPGVSKDMVRKVLKDLKNQGKIESEGRGRGASWHKRGNNF